jgi:hypothetical protein
MSDDEVISNDAPIELSDEELEDVSGGLNLLLNAAFFRRTRVSSSKGSKGVRGGGSAPSVASAETVESAGLQVLITEATTADLEALGGLLHDAAAIDGKD